MQRFGPVGEGGKSVCSPNMILKERSDCMVVSVGLNGDTSFEEALHTFAPHCRIHGYDGTLVRMVNGVKSTALVDRLPKWMAFHPHNFNAKSARGFADQPSNHQVKVIDLLKMDCETCENSALLPWLNFFCTEQILLEYHSGASPAYPCGTMFSSPKGRTNNMHRLFTQLHKDYDIFYFEDNEKRRGFCGEYAFKRRVRCPRAAGA